MARQILYALGGHGAERSCCGSPTSMQLSETHAGRPGVFGRVGVVGVVGYEDGAHKIIADTFQALNDIGLTLPVQGATYWNAEAMNPRDYKDLDEPPEAVASTTKRRSHATPRIWPGS
jgi:hypothetical protein